MVTPPSHHAGVEDTTEAWQRGGSSHPVLQGQHDPYSLEGEDGCAEEQGKFV